MAQVDIRTVTTEDLAMTVINQNNIMAQAKETLQVVTAEIIRRQAAKTKSEQKPKKKK